MMDRGAGREARPLSLSDGVEPQGPPRAVYVHAPFCASRCQYCDFAVTVSDGGDPRAWLEALAWELDMVSAEGHFAPGPVLESLFVGGGTPSLLGPGAMAGLAGVLGEPHRESPDLEWTAEANPDSFTEPLARAWAEAGVNRISLGVQSLDERVLRWLGRRHGATEAVEAVGRARRAGIANMSLDLIFGLPLEVSRDWTVDLDRVLGLEVPHVSLYGLTVEAGTPLARAVARGELTPIPDEAYRDQYLQATERLRSEGYEHYEVSNFALPGFEGRHNQAYWELNPYLGLGNSAHSYREGRRRWNLRDWPAYQEARMAGNPPWASEERLGPAEVCLERIWLGLRAKDGLVVRDPPTSVADLMDRWVADELAEREGDSLRLTARGWLVLDELTVDFDRAVGRSRPGSVKTELPTG